METGTGFCLATLCVLNADTVGQYSCFTIYDNRYFSSLSVYQLHFLRLHKYFICNNRLLRVIYSILYLIKI